MFALLALAGWRHKRNETSLCVGARTGVAMRLSSGGLDQLRERLAVSDWAVLDSLSRLRLATAGQLRRLHWDEAGPSRTARRRLNRWSELRVIARLERRIGGVRSGSDGFVYALDVVGQRLLGSVAGRAPDSFGRAFLKHRLAVTEIYVSCVEAERTGTLKLIEFAAEPDCWRPSALGTLKPDAYVALASGEFEHYGFIEVDCATEATTTLSAKAAAYQRYYQTGIEQARLGLFPQVIWAVPTDHRLAQIVDVLARLPPESWRLHRMLRLDQVPERLVN